MWLPRLLMLPCLIYVREGDRARLGPNKQTLPVSVRYSKYIRKAVFGADTAAFEARGLTSASTPEAFHQCLTPLHGHVIGVALFRPLWCSSLMRYMTEAQQNLRRYWLQTKYADCQFVYSHIIAAQSFLQPVPVRPSVVRASSGASVLVHSSKPTSTK